MHKPVPAIAAFLLGGTAFAQSQRPNVILFVVDDMGPMDTSVPFLADSCGSRPGQVSRDRHLPDGGAYPGSPGAD